MRESLPVVLAQQFAPDLDVASWATRFVDWLLDNLGFLFTFLRTIIGTLVGWVETVLITPPVIVVIAVFTLLAFVATRWGFALFTLLAFLLIDAMGHFEATMLSLALVLVAAALAVLVGIPLGILAARNDTASTLIKPLMDFMQTMPAFVYLLLAVFFFRIGVVPGVVASLVFSMPPAVRLTELGIRHVDQEVVEAAEAFGARPRAVLTGVQLPLAAPSIMAGVNQVIMLALSMVVIAGLAGAGGLGGIIVEGVQRLQIGLGFEGGLAVVILAIFLDRVTAGFGSGDAGLRRSG
jgi:glycine betaine/proline transport system permease protein